MKRTTKRRCFLLACLFALIQSLLLIYNACIIQKYIPIKIFKCSSVKYILYYTKQFGIEDFYLGLGSEIFAKCKYKNCYATNNRSLVPIEQFSAIIFHGAEYSIHRDGFPKRRSPNQVYIFSNAESPLYSNLTAIGETRSFYNWTMTYRQDSDIPRRYGYVRKRKTNYTLPSLEKIRKKKFRIAWFVSHCSVWSMRSKLAKFIGKYVPVDIYGKCGNLRCDDEGECLKMLDKYKFYFAAENSICKDYITEKAYQVLKRNVIPIVYGGADYNQLTPPKSVIDVTKFHKVKDLADHLEFLHYNPRQYRKYLKWKQHYTIDSTLQSTICSLCEKLHKPIETKVYHDILTWFAGEKSSQCKLRSGLPNIVRYP